MFDNEEEKDQWQEDQRVSCALQSCLKDTVIYLFILFLTVHWFCSKRTEIGT